MGPLNTTIISAITSFLGSLRGLAGGRERDPKAIKWLRFGVRVTVLAMLMFSLWAAALYPVQFAVFAANLKLLPDMYWYLLLGGILTFMVAGGGGTAEVDAPAGGGDESEPAPVETERFAKADDVDPDLLQGDTSLVTPTKPVSPAAAPANADTGGEG